MYKATVLCDSMADGVRLTTMEVTFPRFILAEFNTHRVFSRNSASSRAIPVHKRIEQVWNNPFIPVAFGVNKSGMQASASLGGWKALIARWSWILASKLCVMLAWVMSKLGVHKQHANRLIELWAWHTVVVSATEWENFFRLRTHKAAQPEMQVTAKCMAAAYESSTPKLLALGQWHLPYVDESDWQADAADDGGAKDMFEMAKISVVKCAAVSFERQHAERTMAQISKRHDDMVRMAHWSPFEHVAQVVPTIPDQKYGRVCCQTGPWHGQAFIGNFRSPWKQYRKFFESEDVWQGGMEE